MVLTAARLVCTNRDDVSVLSHVWEAMDEYLDYSSRWTLERAAAEGMKFLMVHAAIANGQAAVLNWLIAVLPVKSLKCEEAAGSWMDVASEYGQVGILKWFHDHATTLPMSVDGHLPACTVEAIEKAARNGHSDVLVYLYENDLVNLTVESDAMNALVAAVEGGHRTCVEWLVVHFRELYEQTRLCRLLLWMLQLLPQTTHEWQTSSKAVDEAARQGFVHVLCWLHFDRAGGYERPLPAVQWLTEHQREVCNNFEAFNAAAYMDHLEVAQFLYNYVRSSCSVEQALEHAEEGGAEDILAWLEGLN
ncbi:Ankyrin repeat-containing domain [Phytophthora cactorum]|nr:Ankyrin repeat-containing domain [Phytophthora cactorum]